MANKPFMMNLNIKKIFFSFTLLLFATFSFAEDVDLSKTLTRDNPNESKSIVSEDEKGNQIIKQKLIWDFDEYAFKFEIILEKQNRKGAFVQIEKIETETNFIELTLTPGIYRYKINVYNLLRRIEQSNDWITFEVIEAKQPRISSMSPKQIYLDEKQDGIYTINGRYLNEKSEYILINKNNRTIKANLIESNKGGTTIKVQIRLRDLQPGQYKFKITNRGGLYTEEDDIKVQFKKAMDFDVFAGYTCSIITFDDTIQQYLNNSVWPLSAKLGCTFIPLKTAGGFFGTGLTANYTRMQADLGNYKITGNFFSTYLNFVYQYPFIKNKLVFDSHIGAGFGCFTNYIFHFSNNIKSQTALNSIGFSCEAGLALQYYFTNRFYTELRVDSSFSIFKDVMLNIVAPGVTVGWQF